MIQPPACPAMAMATAACSPRSVEVLDDLASSCETASTFDDSGMSSLPSPDVVDEDGRRCFVKLLIPLAAAGCIIRRREEVMGHLMRSTGVEVSMSGDDQCYPGSTYGVCALRGSPTQVYDAIGFIVKRETMCRHLGIDAPVPVENVALDEALLSEVHFVVPDPVAGVVIGKGGQKIREINAVDGGNVSVSYKQFPKGCIEERRISSHGIFSYVMGFTKRLIDLLVKQPGHDCFPHVVYRGKQDMVLAPRASSTGGGSNAQQHGPDARNVMDRVQLVFSPVGVKNVLSDEMFEALVVKVNEKNGNNLRETCEIMGAISKLSELGKLRLVPAGEGIPGVLQGRGVPPLTAGPALVPGVADLVSASCEANNRPQLCGKYGPTSP